MSYEKKYLKYKQKYLDLKNQVSFTQGDSFKEDQIVAIPKSLNSYLGGARTYMEVIDVLKSKLNQKLNRMASGLRGGEPRGWYLIEGNIGSGKSTLLQKLGELQHVEIIPEPVKEWEVDVQGTSLLKSFYKDMPRFGFIFQIVALQTIIESLHEREQTEYFRFSERSIWSSKNIFATLAMRSGNINPLEAYYYNKFFNWIEKIFPQKPKGIIYVQCSPEISHARVNKRNRAGEEGIPLAYLTDVHVRHEEWFAEWAREPGQHPPVYTINNNADDNYPAVIRQVFTMIGEEAVPLPKAIVAAPAHGGPGGH